MKLLSVILVFLSKSFQLLLLHMQALLLQLWRLFRNLQLFLSYRTPNSNPSQPKPKPSQPNPSPSPSHRSSSKHLNILQPKFRETQPLWTSQHHAVNVLLTGYLQLMEKLSIVLSWNCSNTFTNSVDLFPTFCFWFVLWFFIRLISQVWLLLGKGRLLRNADLSHWIQNVIAGSDVTGLWNFHIPVVDTKVLVICCVVK